MERDIQQRETYFRTVISKSWGCCKGEVEKRTIRRFFPFFFCLIAQEAIENFDTNKPAKKKKSFRFSGLLTQF